MKKTRLWLSCLLMVMLFMHIDTQAQEFVQNRQVITTQQSHNAPSLHGDQHRATNQTAQAELVQAYQKRTIQFEPISDSQKEAKKAKLKYKSGQFKRPKQNPRNKE